MYMTFFILLAFFVGVVTIGYFVGLLIGSIIIHLIEKYNGKR